MKKIQYNGESKLLSGVATKINWLIDQVGQKIDASEKGVANGVATLDGGGKVPSSQLPSYVDDVVEGYYYNDDFYEDSAHTELITPETSKIYVDLPTSKTYRWGGSEYVEISSSMDEKVKQTPYIADAETREILLAKSTDGYEHTEGTYKTSALKFFYGGNGLGMLYIGDYDSQYGYYNGEVHCNWVNCEHVTTKAISGMDHITLGNSQTKGYIYIYDENDNIVELIPNSNMQTPTAVYLPASTGTLALQSEIPTNVSNLTDDIGIVKWSEQNVLGAKNFIPHITYNLNGYEQNGIKFTVTNEGYVIANGTKTTSANNSTFNLSERYEDTGLFLPNGKYVLTGCPSGGGNATYQIGAAYRNASSTYVTLGYESGSGIEFTINGSQYSNDGAWVRVFVVLWGGYASASNLMFRPMIRLKSVSDSTYEPPAETNRQLTLNKISRDEYIASGVKNYFQYPFYPHPIGVEQHTNRGVLFTDNGDGGVKANGVNDNTGNSYCQLASTDSVYHFMKLPKGKYHFSGGISDDYYLNLSWGLETSPTNRTVIDTDYGDGFDFEVTEAQANNNIYCSFAFVKQGKTADNVVFYPSITRLEDRDSGFAKFAMTNLQLTNNKVDKDGYILDDEDLNDLIYPGFYLARNDNHILNKPSGFNQFGLIVSKTASSAQYYNQRLIRPNVDGEVYSRNCVNGTWTSWVKEYSIWNSDNYLGVRNFLPYRYYNNSGLVSNGVTFTINSDGSISCSGTSTGNAVFNVTQREVNGGLFLPNGTYVLSGCPEGGSTSTSAGAYQMIVSRTSGNTQVNYGTDAGSGYSFTVNGDDFSNDGAWVRVYIVCRRTVVSDTLVFKPMVRKSNETDTTFVSPADSNRKLSAERLNTDEIAPSENSSTASQAYAVGDYMIRNGKLFRVTTAITSGGSIISSGNNANIVKTTLAEELLRALS